MKGLITKIVSKVKNVVNTTIQAIKNGASATVKAIVRPVLQYRKGNTEAAIGGVVAGLALLGGALSQTFAGSFTALLGNNAQYLADFLGILGFIALMGGIMEYRKRK
ncbi:conjugal transfer protein [Sulfolobus tengchongensis]|uniref:Conjugal transfer protein n=1 Tax=Sulfolobus tengchongensis TaxID=207809 RepID=A0AAX4KZW0_9CREN